MDAARRRRAQTIESSAATAVDAIELDAPLLTALTTEGRKSGATVPLSVKIAPRMVQAVIAIEDRRFYEHSGVTGSARPGAVSRTSSAAEVPGRRQHDHSAAREEHLPESMWGLEKAREKDPSRSSPSG